MLNCWVCLKERTAYTPKKSMEKHAEEQVSPMKKKNWTEKESVKEEGSPSFSDLMIPNLHSRGEKERISIYGTGLNNVRVFFCCAAIRRGLTSYV